MSNKTQTLNPAQLISGALFSPGYRNQRLARDVSGAWRRESAANARRRHRRGRGRGFRIATTRQLPCPDRIGEPLICG